VLLAGFVWLPAARPAHAQLCRFPLRSDCDQAHFSVEWTQSSNLLRQRDEIISLQNLRFESAINNMLQGLCLFDVDERLIVCNRQFVDMYRLDAARVLPGTSLGTIIDMRYDAGSSPNMPKEEYLAWRRRMGREGFPESRVHELADGRVFQIHYRPMADGGWVATHEDITEQRMLSQKLEERTVLLQAIIDNFPGGIGYFDRDLRVAVCNDRAKAILDLPEAFFANGPPLLEDLIRFNAERGEYGPGDTEEQIRSKVALARDRHTYRFERQRPDGTVLDVRGAPLDNGGFITTYMDITERYRAEARITHLAMHDPLTGLANRTLFRERLNGAVADARAGERGVALLAIDLNKFKQVNDTLGHPVGDQLLQAVAERLRRCVRQEDCVARLGGDEFAVVLHAANPIEDARGLAGRILQALCAPYSLGDHWVSVGGGIGIAISDGATTDAEQMIRQADIALYRTKADGGSTYSVFDPSMDRRAQRVA
jgi:diguanylate cyclase (GGDEF)-like protein